MKTRNIVTWSMTSLLTFLFILSGMATLLDNRIAAKLAEYNLSTAARNTIGFLEIAGGLALLIPAVAWQVAACMTLAMGAAVLAHLFYGQNWLALVPAVLAGMLATVGYLRHPRSSLLSRIRAAADAFAERELARQRQRHSPA
jgi:uncharacterized membrane protein